MREQEVELSLIIDLLPDLLDQFLVQVELHGLRAVVRFNGGELALDQCVNAEGHARRSSQERQLRLNHRLTAALLLLTIVQYFLVILIESLLDESWEATALDLAEILSKDIGEEKLRLEGRVHAGDHGLLELLESLRIISADGADEEHSHYELLIVLAEHVFIEQFL